MKNFDKNIVTRQIYARKKLIFSILMGVTFFYLIQKFLILENLTRFIISWDTGVLFYLLQSSFVIAEPSHEKMRIRAKLQNEGAFAVLALTVLAVIASLAAVAGGLAAVKQLEGIIKYSHITLTLFTLISSWLFMHLVFSFHYAHLYYAEKDITKHGGLDFPSDELPDYFDFLYFSYIIGTSGQTADVNISSKKMRKINLIHCIISFMFNAVILALTVNIASSLF